MKRIFFGSSIDCFQMMNCQREELEIWIEEGGINEVIMCRARGKKFSFGFLVGHIMLEFKRISLDTLS
jgi:hypothetical protein